MINNENITDSGTGKKAKNQIFYSKGEELFNIVSHLAGAVFAVVAAALVIAKCSINTLTDKYNYPALAIVSVCLYSLTIILLYLTSTLYHSRKFGGKARTVFRRLDHCMIAMLIAGTYMPFSLIGLVEYGTKQPGDFVWGVIIASLVFAGAVLTVVFNAVSVHRFRYFSMAAYVLMGWCGLMRIYSMYLAVGGACFLFLLLGGITYTVGIIFYSIKKIKFNHAIWHMFVIAGSVFHFISIYFFLL